MSISDYISSNEIIISHISVEMNDSSVLENTFGVTAKKVFWFKKLKHQNVEYRDIPLEKISSIENYWHNRQIGKIIFGISLIIIALVLSIYLGFFGLILLIPLFIIGIVLIIKGLKQYGQFNVIGIQNTWGFQFRRKEDIRRIQQFIRSIYHIIPSANIALISKQTERIETLEGTKYCPNCGIMLIDGNEYCTRCGTKI